MTGRTCLSLSGVCQDSMPDSVRLAGRSCRCANAGVGSRQRSQHGERVRSFRTPARFNPPQKLDITFCEGKEGVTDLPDGPFRRSLTELETDWALAEAALRAGPSHALWDLPQLCILHAWGMGDASEADKAAFRAAAAERLLGLQKQDV